MYDESAVHFLNMLLADIRILASVLVGLLGLAFLLHASARSNAYVHWLAGSAVATGVLQLGLRLLELQDRIAPRVAGTLGAAVGLLAWAAMLAGLQAFFRPGGTPPRRLFWAAAIGAPLAVVLVHAASDGWPFSGSLATALLFTGTALWLLQLWRESCWQGLFVLAGAFMLQPLLLSWALDNGLDVQAFRELMPVPLTLIYVMVFTLILERDTELLVNELDGRRRAEADLRVLAATLDDRVQLRTRQLEDMVAGLKSFAGMVSHDLRGPLGNTGSLARLATLALSEGRPDEARRWLQLIERESGRGGAMIDDLLRLSRVDQAPLALSDVDLQALVCEGVEALALQFPGAAQRVACTSLPQLRGDAGMLRQVVLNLLSNALKFGAGRPDLRIVVRGRREGAHWRIEVSDNGPGFDPARARELFQPFARLAKPDVPGSGIGLTIVRRVVERHGGQVGVDTTPGHGSTFWWTLPAAVDAAPGLARGSTAA